MGYAPNGKRVVAKWHANDESEPIAQAERAHWVGKGIRKACRREEPQTYRTHSVLTGCRLSQCPTAWVVRLSRLGLSARSRLAMSCGTRALRGKQKKGRGLPSGGEGRAWMLAEPAPKGQVSGGQLGQAQGARKARGNRPPTAAGTGSHATPRHGKGGTPQRARVSKSPSISGRERPSTKPHRKRHRKPKGGDPTSRPKGA